MQATIAYLNGLIWSPALIGLCLCAGLIFSIATRFAQVRHFKEMIHLLVSGKSSGRGVSSFQALTISLSGRVGTGNIAGVAAAIGFGGPGAVLWMWVVAFFGAASAYIESTNAQIYKEVDSDGIYHGGPAYYIEKALGWRWYSWTFAVATVISCGILLPTVQSNSISKAMEVAFGDGLMLDSLVGQVSLVKLVSGIVITSLTAIIILGGVKRIAHLTQVIVPFMAVSYLLVALLIIALHIDMLPAIIVAIFSDAFSPMAGAGAAIGWGIKRGVYSNEAGQGNGAHAAAAAEVEHPAQQGLVQAFSVYIDTLVVCSATAFMILITQSYNVRVEGTEHFIVQHLAADVAANSPAFTQIAIDSMFSGLGKPFVAIALFFFAFTSILALYFIAENNVTYINRRFKLPLLIPLSKGLILAATFYGAIKTANIAWGLGDIGIGMMAWLNIIAILIISVKAAPALKALKDYEAQKKAGVTQYCFDPQALGIKNASFWEQKNQADKEQAGSKE